MVKKLIAAFLFVILVVVIATLVSPWPSVLIVRHIFDRGAAEASAVLAPLVPKDVAVDSGLSYDPGDPDALLDVYRGATATRSAPTIVWFHGGGFVSGRRADVNHYLKILAAQGFNVVNVDYTIAPEATYPTPIRQANKALAFISSHAARLKINPDTLVLAGDSAGAQIAAQTAAMITNTAYANMLGIPPGARADQIAGALLYCGVYDITGMGSKGGIAAWFVNTATWAYSGKRDWRQAPGFDSMSIIPHLSDGFPRTFISAGNADPLGPQSVALANALTSRGIGVTTLFYPADHQPPLGHEYQFRLDGDDGRRALTRSVAWLRTL